MLSRLTAIPSRALDLLCSHRVRVEGHSMMPLLREGDLLLATRRFPGGVPKRGDVVVLKHPSTGERMIKRICGLPGEKVELFDDGLLTVNGVRVTEPYVHNTDVGARRYGDSRWVIPDASYMVLGDNRADSLDGRAYGPIERRLILSRVWYRYAPGERSGALPLTDNGGKS